MKKFVPLITIFSLIILFTVFMVKKSGGFDLMYAMRMFMGAFFIAFGGFKVIKLEGFVEAYSMYDIITKRFRPYGYVYPFIELGLGIAYLMAFNLLYTNIIALVVMVIGAIGVAKKLMEHEEIPCACLGVVFKLPMTKVTFFEDLLMVVMAAWMITLLL